MRLLLVNLLTGNTRPGCANYSIFLGTFAVAKQKTRNFTYTSSDYGNNHHVLQPSSLLKLVPTGTESPSGFEQRGHDSIPPLDPLVTGCPVSTSTHQQAAS